MVNQGPTALFTPDFQQRVVSLLVRDRRFSAGLSAYIRPEQFSDVMGGAYLREAVRFIKHWNAEYSEHAQTLPRYVFEQWGHQWTLQQSANVEYHRAAWLRLGWDLYENTQPGDDYVREQTIAWVKHQEQQLLLIEAKEKFAAGTSLSEFGLLTRVRDIDRISAMQSDIGITLGFNAAVEYDRFMTVKPRLVLPLGYDRLDAAVSGGMGRKELLVIAAPPNTGKTTVACSFSARWMKKGHFVVYYTLEQAREQIHDKHIGAHTNVLPDTLRQHPECAQAWINYLCSSGGRLIVQEYPMGKATVDDIAQHLTAVEAVYGRLPDVVVVDYADLMKSQGKYDQLRHNVSLTYTDLRGLASEFNVLVVTPTQTNRSSVGEEVVTIEHLAEAFDKAAIADVIIALCQTEQEEKDGVMRLFLAKNRHGKKYMSFPYRVNPQLTRLEEQERAEYKMGAEQAGYGMLLAQAQPQLLSTSSFVNHFKAP